MLRVDVLTLFPEMFKGPMTESILKRAQEKGFLNLRITNIRDFAHDKHQVTDDYPYGGGSGMVMKPEPIFEATEWVTARAREEGVGQSRIILMCPQGELFTQQKAMELAKEEHLVFICGRYEGVDERVRLGLVTDELSIGDYVLTGGELPAMVVIDAVVRVVPGVLHGEESVSSDSFTTGLLEGPQYTRPRDYRGMSVPEVLLSGNHEVIRRWRRREALRRTMQRCPDLLARIKLTDEDRELLRQIEDET